MKLLFLALFVLSAGCNRSIPKWVDQYSFSRFGTTVFSDSPEVSLKEIHLDAGKLLGRPIVIEGSIVEVGKHDTHLVITDDSARLLITLTRLAHRDLKLQQEGWEQLRIFGTVGRGKKGLPYVSAIAISNGKGRS